MKYQLKLWSPIAHVHCINIGITLSITIFEHEIYHNLQFSQIVEVRIFLEQIVVETLAQYKLFMDDLICQSKLLVIGLNLIFSIYKSRLLWPKSWYFHPSVISININLIRDNSSKCPQSFMSFAIFSPAFFFRQKGS